ncbi:MAG: hypothetical protein G8345_13825 [Magnetococcales bacterium]|nr:hypothetical protein [Magnetococcales bacterium]NGZ27954.1 hypothetical protein [Magnetococcales bacterium]
MTRFKAFATHLATSVTIVTTFFLMILFWWYPGGFLEVEGVKGVMMVLLGVDVVLGPTLMLILFKPGKKGLWFDVTAILVVQVTAFLYGATVIYTERPLYLSFYIDNFTVVPASKVAGQEGGDASVQPSFWQVGPKKVFVRRPSDKERSEIVGDLLNRQGVGLEMRTKLFLPYEEHVQKVVEAGEPLSALYRSNPEVKPLVAAVLQKFQMPEDGVIHFPVKGREGFRFGLFSKKDASLLDILPLVE